MNGVDPETHGFIIRIWRESRDGPQVTPEWRGMIEHVEDGKRQYFLELSRIVEFIRPYVKRMTVKPRWNERLKQWLER